MALLEGKPASKTLPIFCMGPYPTTRLKVSKSKAPSNSNPCPPPEDLLIFTPTEGTHPVILFFHGFCLKNCCYSDLLQQISSHGYVVVAPQLTSSSCISFNNCIPCFMRSDEAFSQEEEIEDAALVANWLQSGLQSQLPINVKANLSNLALAGHSRGGKTAFALALGKAQTQVTVKFSVLIGVDPVAGPKENKETTPKILTGGEHSFNLSIPVVVIGTGFHGFNKCYIPAGVNHVEFFKRCSPPCGYFVTPDYGHLDMLNTFCCIGKKDMRRCVGGIVVAFMKDSFDKNWDLIMTIVQDPSCAPVKLDPCYFH